jgi:hypothetical protein
MPTITVTSADMALMQSTDVAATHLLVVAQGRPTNRSFTVPPGKTVRQYAGEPSLLRNALGPVALIMQGKMRPSVMASAGHRIPDYTLTPIRGYAGRPGTADPLYAALLRYVEQAGRITALQAVNGSGLGPGVPCDILCLRPRRVSSWFQSGYPRLSQLTAEGLLAQYAHLHCLLGPAVRQSAVRKK